MFHDLLALTEKPRVDVICKKSRWSAPFQQFSYELRQKHGSVIAAGAAEVDEADQPREPDVKEKIMAAVAAGHDGQEAIADYVGKNIRQLRSDIKELIAENALIEGTGPRGRKIYQLSPKI